MPTLEEASEFLQKYLPFTEEQVMNTLIKCESVFVLGSTGNLKAVLTYRKINSGHHIHFMVAVDKSSRKLLVKEGKRLGITPVSAFRHGKIKIYKNPLKLINRIG